MKIVFKFIKNYINNKDTDKKVKTVDKIDIDCDLGMIHIPIDIFDECNTVVLSLDNKRSDIISIKVK